MLQVRQGEETVRVTKAAMERLQEENEHQVALDKKIIKDLQVGLFGTVCSALQCFNPSLRYPPCSAGGVEGEGGGSRAERADAAIAAARVEARVRET